MANSLSKEQQALLNEAEANVKFVEESTQYRTTMKDMKQAFDFVEGRQFTKAEEQELLDRGQPVIVVNRIAVNLDNIIGQEVASRVNIGVSPRSFAEDALQMAAAHNILAQYVQERESVAYKLSIRNMHRYSGGMGWIERDVRDGKLRYENVNPFEMGWDVTDYTKNLTDSRFQYRKKWLSIEEAKRTFPDKAKELDALVLSAKEKKENDNLPSYDPEAKFDEIDSAGYVDVVKDRIKVVEYQYKTPAKKYRTFTANNRVIETFDEDEAKKLLDKKLEQDIVEFDSCIVNVIFFTEGVLLKDETPLIIQNENFSWQFSGYKRTLNGCFYGLVKGAIPAQQELNKRRSKAMHLLNSNRVRLSPQALKDNDINELLNELNSPDGFVIADQGEIELLDQNTREFSQQLQMMMRAQDEIDMVMGSFSEALGEPSNAVSGVAIQKRQLGAQRNQIRALDDHREARKQFGRDMISGIQATVDRERAIHIINEDDLAQSYIVVLNEPGEVDGNPVINNDVRSLDYDIVIEEVPEYNAPPEQVAQTVQQILMNGQGAFLTQPEVLTILGIPTSYAKRISAAFTKALQASPQQAAAEAPSAGVNAGTPSLETL